MSSEPAYEVVAPTGWVAENDIPVNLHPTSLSNRTVAFVWDYLFKGPVMFDAIRQLIDARFGQVGFVDHQYFGDIHGLATMQELMRYCDAPRVLEGLPEKLRNANVDVAVVAVGA
jgi:hypothetical protein